MQVTKAQKHQGDIDTSFNVLSSSLNVLVKALRSSWQICRKNCLLSFFRLYNKMLGFIFSWVGNVTTWTSDVVPHTTEKPTRAAIGKSFYVSAQASQNRIRKYRLESLFSMASIQLKVAGFSSLQSPGCHTDRDCSTSCLVCVSFTTLITSKCYNSGLLC